MRQVLALDSLDPMQMEIRRVPPPVDLTFFNPKPAPVYEVDIDPAKIASTQKSQGESCGLNAGKPEGSAASVVGAPDADGWRPVGEPHLMPDLAGNQFEAKVEGAEKIHRNLPYSLRELATTLLANGKTGRLWRPIAEQKPAEPREFKAGDLVKIIHDNSGYEAGHDEDMRKYVGRTGRLLRKVFGGKCWNVEGGGTWSWDPRSLELVSEAPQ